MAPPRMGIIRPHAGKLEVLLRLVDCGLVAATLYVACWGAGVRELPQYHLLATTSLVFFLVFSEAGGLYRTGRGISLREELLKFGQIWTGVLITLVLASFVMKTTSSYSRGVIICWFLLVLAASSVLRFGLRLALREARRRGYNLRRATIVGCGEMGRRVGATISESPEMGLWLVGYFDDRDPQRLDLPPDGSIRVKGKLDDLVDMAQEGRIDIVYITWALKAETRIKELIHRLSATTVSVYIVPDFLVYDLLHARWSSLAGLPAVSVVETPFAGVDGLLKRVEDLVLGPLLLAIVLIPMAVVALLVKVIDGGPVLFKQRRYGLDGKEIEIWKFRTMIAPGDGTPFTQATRGDARITRLGTVLRRTSLDELPQFFNVVQGRLSIVGPRPHPVALNEQYRRLIYRYMIRHKVKPGITGLAQISGLRGETDTLQKMEQRVEHDLEYIRNWSLLLDLKIIAMTTVRGFTGTNAY